MRGRRSSPICCGRPGGPARRAAPARLPVSVGAHAVQRADHGDPPQNPAPFRAAGTRRSQLHVSLAGGRRTRRSTSAPTPWRNRCSRSTGSSCRSRRITTRWRRTSACAPSIRAISSRPPSPGQDGLTMRAFTDGSPYGNEDLFFASQAEPQRALHARCRNARHVPERAPHRRRRPDVSLSAELACAMARRRRCDGPPDRAVARAEVVRGIVLGERSDASRRMLAKHGPAPSFETRRRRGSSG